MSDCTWPMICATFLHFVFCHSADSVSPLPSTNKVDDKCQSLSRFNEIISYSFCGGIKLLRLSETSLKLNSSDKFSLLTNVAVIEIPCVRCKLFYQSTCNCWQILRFKTKSSEVEQTVFFATVDEAGTVSLQPNWRINLPPWI